MTNNKLALNVALRTLECIVEHCCRGNYPEVSGLAADAMCVVESIRRGERPFTVRKELANLVQYRGPDTMLPENSEAKP